MTEAETDAGMIIPEREILDKKIHFPNGLPGFPESTDFLLSQSDGEKPFGWLRDIGNADLAFAVIEAYHLVPDYMIEIDDEELSSIGSPSPKNCAILLILRIEMEDKITIHANLKSPVVINTLDRLGGQFILGNSSYSEDVIFKF